MALTSASGSNATLPLAATAARLPLILEATIPLDEVSGRIDHMAIDLASHRLFVAELGNDSVDVIDLQTHKAIHRISGIREPQGIGVAARFGVIAVTSGQDGSVHFYRSGDFSALGSISLGDDADNVRVDIDTGHFIVGYGQGGLAILDPVTRAKIGEIKLRAHPESFQFTADGNLAFVNLPEANQIAMIAAGRQIASWSVPGLRANFPLALDLAESSVAVVFRSPPRLALLNVTSGAVRAQVETCGDADDVFFDAKRKRVYVSCGEGFVDVFDQNQSELKPLGRIETAPGARTSLFVPDLDRLFVASRAGDRRGAQILIFRPG